MATRASDARAAVDLSFEELYRGHHADVFRAALRELGNVHDAEDVTQAAFVDAYRAVLRGSRPESPRAWLLAIAENVRRRRYRTAQRRPREELFDDADFPLAAELDHELAHALAEALAALPADQRQVFVLRELAGLSYEEIADETDSTVGAIQMQLFRARRSLRDQLDPPTVARRRAGLLVPLPGWLTTIFTRPDVSFPVARAAGALGTAAVTVVAATVAVSEVRADAPPAVVDPRPVAVERATVDPAPAAPRKAPTVRLATVVSSAPPAKARARTPAQPAEPAEPQPPSTPVSVQPEAPAPTAAPPRPRATVVETVTSVLEPPRLPIRLPVEKVERVLELPELPPLSTAPVLEAASGAARAAGDGAQPLPVPGVPPVTVPPLP
jgi:RNA polymerase sigma-70 factor (ECF subfamily)